MSRTDCSVPQELAYLWPNPLYLHSQQARLEESTVHPAMTKDNRATKKKKKGEMAI